MNPISVVGAFVITLSLLSYGIGSITLIRFKMIGNITLTFLSVGIIFDISATTLMIIGARDTPFSLHALVGYTAFLVMLITTIWAWFTYFKKGIDSSVSKWLRAYTKFAYLCWVCAYFAGSLTILWR